ncbi:MULTISPECIES: superoxide dismutase family protein [unclassified Sphingomonas]|uniref:superoxide dismutase family protein n=1 Tax=unclassified Sphingomonas TaxID=196159 RepID=UPI000BD8AD23|nr:MAG: superoxide dismutase [Sphingomonas sp. 12-62-6]OYX37667.1 MAG: superoxide dismutase [Sphingomonas sp. 32-62-10]OYY66045.1 MAG: superoxide dismutase [Sphingomonas sp. 28-62-11]
MRIAIMAGAALAVIGMGGCASGANDMGAQLPAGRIAVASLLTAAGTPVGRSTAREVTGGLRVTIDATGLPEGTHGAHIHTTGRCDGPDFMTAGGHWNPAGTQHGSLNPAGPHEGDLPNIIIGTDGRGTLGVLVPGGTLDGLLDADGGAMVIHAAADDMMTDPSGKSGARIACGVFSVN